MQIILWDRGIWGLDFNLICIIKVRGCSCAGQPDLLLIQRHQVIQKCFCLAYTNIAYQSVTKFCQRENLLQISLHVEFVIFRQNLKFFK